MLTFRTNDSKPRCFAHGSVRQRQYFEQEVSRHLTVSAIASAYSSAFLYASQTDLAFKKQYFPDVRRLLRPKHTNRGLFILSLSSEV